MLIALAKVWIRQNEKFDRDACKTNYTANWRTPGGPDPENTSEHVTVYQKYDAVRLRNDRISGPQGGWGGAQVRGGRHRRLQEHVSVADSDYFLPLFSGPDFVSVVQLGATCKRLNQLIKDDHIWRPMHKKRFIDGEPFWFLRCPPKLLSDGRIYVSRQDDRLRTRSQKRGTGDGFFTAWWELFKAEILLLRCYRDEEFEELILARQDFLSQGRSWF